MRTEQTETPAVAEPAFGAGEASTQSFKVETQLHARHFFAAGSVEYHARRVQKGETNGVRHRDCIQECKDRQNVDKMPLIMSAALKDRMPGWRCGRLTARATRMIRAARHNTGKQNQGTNNNPPTRDGVRHFRGTS